MFRFYSQRPSTFCKELYMIPCSNTVTITLKNYCFRNNRLIQERNIVHWVLNLSSPLLQKSVGIARQNRASSLPLLEDDSTSSVPSTVTAKEARTDFLGLLFSCSSLEAVAILNETQEHKNDSCNYPALVHTLSA